MRTSKKGLKIISDSLCEFRGETYGETGKKSTEGAREFATFDNASTIWINAVGLRVLDHSEKE